MSNQLQKLAWITGLALVLVHLPVLAEDNQKPRSKISQLSDTEKPATTIQQWLAQSLVQVTDVKLQATDKGIELILATNQSDKLQLANKSEGNSYIVEIPNAQVSLSSGDTFRQEKPTAGISEVIVTNLDANTIRVTVTGESGAPQVELFDGDEGLVFGVVTTATTTQTPPQPEQPSAQNEAPIELVVTGEQDTYRVPEASAATRTDTPIRDIPQSIQVIPRQVLKDQQVIRLTDAIRNVSGVIEGDSFGGTVDNFNIRGFDFTSNFRDGFKDSGDNLRELANIEQIEVLKGPASVLYGNAEPGGIINLVTKKPLATPYYSGEFSVGNFSYYRSAIDLSGPLDADKSLLYRLNTAYENTGSFRDFVSGERFFFGPVFDLKLGDNTNLLFDVSYLKDERTMDQGIVAIGREVANIPNSRFLGEPGDIRRVEEVNVGYRLEHRFSENLTLRNAFRYTSNDTFDYRAQPLVVDEETGELSRNFRSNKDYFDRYSLQTDLIGKFTTGSIQHTLLFGLDVARENRDGSQRRLPGGLTPSINIFNPVYNVIPRPALSELNAARNGKSTTETLGIYLQDQIAFSDNFKLLLGGRENAPYFITKT
jgi:iron complex outermembrane receptor protein